MLELILLGIEGSMENILSGIWATGEGIQEYGFRQKWGSLRSKYLGVNLLLLIPCPSKHNFGKREAEDVWGYES